MKDTDISYQVRQEVLARDSVDDWPCCVFCGKPAAEGGKGLHLHHITRRSHGGKGSADNLVSLCWECHSKLHSGNEDIQHYCEDYLRRTK